MRHLGKNHSYKDGFHFRVDAGVRAYSFVYALINIRQEGQRDGI